MREMGITQWNQDKAPLWIRGFSCHFSFRMPIKIILGYISAGAPLLTVCKHEDALGENLGPAVSLKSAPAQLPGADAAVPGLFSVKQPGLLAFKRALHALHHPWEEIKTTFSQSHLPLNQSNLKTSSHEQFQHSKPICVICLLMVSNIINQDHIHRDCNRCKRDSITLISKL